MASLGRIRWQIAILFLFVASAVGFSSGHLLLRQQYLARKIEGMKTSITTPPNPVETPDTTQESIGFEREGNGIAEALLAPIPRSVCLLAQLTSMQNLDTALRATARNQSSILQHAHSFQHSLLQISLKLNNAFLVSNIYGYKIKLHGVIVSSKVKVAAEYLEKFRNSDRIFKVIDLPVEDLKDTADQILNFSSQIAGQFGELVQLVDEFSKSLTLKTEKIRNATADIENDGFEMMDLKRQKRLDEADVNNAMDELKHLQEDKSQCYLAYNWRTLKWDIWTCPKPDPSRIRQANESVKIAQKKLENTMKLLHAKEEEAQKKREDNNELLVRSLENTGSSLSRLKSNVTEQSESWNKFVVICGSISSVAAKSLDIIKETKLWNNHLSEKISINLNKTNKDLSLMERVMNIYLEGSDKLIMKTVLEIEEIMKKRETAGIGVPHHTLPGKCDVVTGEIRS